jgi:hypothetical protein
MSTSYVLSCLKTGIYRDGEEGIELPYAGIGFWLPYQKVTPIPNFAFREVDHPKSTPERGEIGQVHYRNEFVDGKRLAEELTLKQIPITNHDKGIQIVEGKPTGQMTVVFGGADAYTGQPVLNEVQEKIATKFEMDRAEKAADAYMRQIIADYFDSKRNRATGGQGRNTPDSVTRFYMELLNVEDHDDVTAHQKQVGGMSPEVVRTIMEEARKSQEINGARLIEAVQTANRSGKAKIGADRKHARKPLGLAEKKAQWEKEHPEEAKTEA